MRHWLQLATRNWRARRLRTAGAVLAIALGTGVVVWVSCCYDSVREAVLVWAGGYIGKSHVSIQSPMGKYDTLDQDLVRKVESVPDVAHVAPLLVQSLPAATLTAAGLAAHGPDLSDQQRTLGVMDFYGIDLAREPAVRDWAASVTTGRMLTEADGRACVLEAALAEEAGVGIGDTLLVWARQWVDPQPTPLTIVGLVERRRIARFQKPLALVRLPVLQELTLGFNRINAIDIVLRDAEGQAMQRAVNRIRAALGPDAPKLLVRSAAARMAQVQRAQEQQRVVLVLLSCVAMLTALFIILSTLSMGMIERIGQLGLLRCIGMTGWQLAWLVLAEVLPLGLLGIVLGVPIGLALTQLTVWLVPEYVQSFTVSFSGIGLASIAGLATTLVAAALPAAAALTVSPLEAARPRARRARRVFLLLALLLAIAVLAAQRYVIAVHVRRDPQFVNWSAAAVVLLYLLYALVTPPLVWLVSRLAVPVIALLMRVRLRLLQDQVGHAVWRSAGICCGLMVGLSLIVGLMVFNESFRGGWQFPKQFPEGYIWSFEQINGDVAGAVARTKGVKNYAVANAVNMIVEERSAALIENILLSVTWFLGVEPDSFLDMVKLEFVEGDEATARRLLRQGGYVLIAADFARSRKKGFHEVRDAAGKVVVRNTVQVWFNNRWTTYKVAGVIDSPALDIAAGYFQAESEARVVAMGSVIGNNADLKRHYGIDGVKLVLLNFDLPPETPPLDWPPPRGTAAARGLAATYYDAKLPLERRWEHYREMRAMEGLCRELNAPQVFYGTARELKDEIDAELTKMTHLLTAVPAVALLVAALGVANLMTANVASRTRQLAVLRAVGATRGLVLRMVIGEALVLGLLGSALGLGLGMHLAWNVSSMTERMSGFRIPFEVPWPFVGAAVALTIGLCILAGIGPARHAARTNVIDALHVA